MATELSTTVRGESHTLLSQEARLREHLEEDLRVRVRFADFDDVRALLVSPSSDDRPKSLIVADDASAAERIYLYVHVAAHMALGHHLPLVTIVEGAPGLARLAPDAHEHGAAERLARAMWWGHEGDLGAPRLVRGSSVLRGLVSRAPTRSLLHGILLALRAAYYNLRIERALSRTGIAAWLRDALCVTAVVSAAPSLCEA